jgi:hypothetical protein
MKKGCNKELTRTENGSETKTKKGKSANIKQEELKKNKQNN